MNSKEVNTSFYLQIFEREVAPYCRISNYELKDMGLADFGEDLSKLEIYEDLKKTTILNLQKISSSNSRSRHVVICISGFLTEEVDKKDSWRFTVNHYKYAEVFAITWNSLSPNTILE